MTYWDYNASTPIRPEVLENLTQSLRTLNASPGNPSSVHAGGRELRRRLDHARAATAKLLGCDPREVCFTGSGSEANALALKGAFLARREKSRRHIVTSQVEHPAVLSALEQLETLGARVLRIAPQPDGRVALEEFLAALTPDVALCSLMWANNETGVVQPIAEVARACNQRGILCHIDAVQAVGKVPVSFSEVGADLLSLSAHKFYGPAGVGALIVRRGLAVEALTPGHQEAGRRGGTHNVPYIEALARALELSLGSLPGEQKRVASLRNRFEYELATRVGDMRINGGTVPRVPNTSNVEFCGADGEALLIGLDLEGICVSSGAACASGSLTPSHVLTAMGLTSAQAHSSLRFSLGLYSTESEVDQVLDTLARQVPKARAAAA